VVVLQEPRPGACAARNTGLAHAQGEWVLFFDSDDEMPANLVERYARAINDHTDLISAPAIHVFPDGTRRNAPFFHRDLLARHILHGQLATQRYIVRRDFINKVGAWDESLPRWNDWELGIRLLLAGARVAFLAPDPSHNEILIHQNRTDSITGVAFHDHKGEWEHVIDLIHSNLVWSEELGVRNSSQTGKNISTLNSQLSKLIEYRRLVLAAQYLREGYADDARALRAQAIDNLRNLYRDSFYWRVIVRPTLAYLYKRIAAGRRGSARIARHLLH